MKRKRILSKRFMTKAVARAIKIPKRYIPNATKGANFPKNSPENKT